MTNCAGCNRRAQKLFKHNESLGLCIPCTRLLPVGMDKHLKWVSEEETRCQACDGPCYWGGDYCSSCRDDVLRYLFRLDKELMDENPWVFELCLPGIRFRQYVNGHNGPETEDWHGLTLLPIKEWTPPIEYHRIKFTRLVYGEENKDLTEDLVDGNITVELPRQKDDHQNHAQP